MQIATRGAGARFCPVASAFQDDDVTPMVDGGQPVVWASSKLREYDRDPQFAWRARNLYPANFLLKETDCKWKTPSQRPSYRRRSSGLRSWSCSSISSSSFRSPKSSGCSTTTWTGRGWDRRCSCSGLYGARVLACMVGVVAVHVGPQRCRHDTSPGRARNPCGNSRRVLHGHLASQSVFGQRSMVRDSVRARSANRFGPLHPSSLGLESGAPHCGPQIRPALPFLGSSPFWQADSPEAARRIGCGGSRSCSTSSPL